MSSQGAAAAPIGLPAPRRQLAMLTICLGVLLSSLDGSIANLGLPAISRELGASPSATVWVATAYQLALVVCLLPFSAAGEALGYRRIYWTGMLAFTAASVGCALAQSLPMLVAMRALQGVGGSAMTGASVALVRFTFPRASLGPALALYALSAGLGMSAGAPVAAAILSLGSWPWLFAVNVPLGLITLAIGARVLPDSLRTPRHVDVVAGVLNFIALTLLVVGIDSLGDLRHLGVAAAELIGAVVVGAVLVRLQVGKAAPLVPIDLLRRPAFALACGTSVCAYAALTSIFVAAPFLMLRTMGIGQFEAGVLVALYPAMVLIAAPLSGRLAERYPVGILAGAGNAAQALGAAAMALLPLHAGELDIGWRMVLAGLGFGFFQTPNNRSILLAAPPERSGAASAMTALMRVLGMAIGSATAAVMLGLFPASGAQAGFWAGAAFAGVGALASFARLKAPVEISH